MYDKIKGFLKDDAIFYALLIVFVGVLSFGLGRLSVLEIAPEEQKGSVVLTKTAEDRTHEAVPAVSTEGVYVASKNGTKYHLPTCPGAKQMSEENKIWFQTKDEAQRAGYSPATNCKGL